MSSRLADTERFSMLYRYDHLINQFYMPSVLEKRDPFVAVGVQIAMERITSAIASFQKNFLELNTRS